MATGTVQATQQPGPDPRLASSEIVEYGRFIENQLQKTRSQVRWVEVSSGLMTLAAGMLAYFLLVAIVDHWIVSAGLGPWGRWLGLLALVAGAAAYIARSVLPVCLQRINPVYAAYTIEKSRPSLKNSLINFLLLRRGAGTMSSVVYQAVEEKAATDLTHVRIESTVDRSGMVRVAYILLGLVVAAGAYTLISPKPPLRSVGRVLFPWADIKAPTRVTLDELLPGDVEVFHGEFVDVSVVAAGVDADEQVTLYYTTADVQSVESPVVLSKAQGDYRHQGVLPPGGNGIQQDMEYYLRAGDAMTARYRVHVLPAPAIAVERVELSYPAYTRLEASMQDRGDIKALEGTRVTIHAKANQEIAAAQIDFNCDGDRNQSFSVTGQTATLSFPLRLKDGKSEFESYQIRFTNSKGHENPQPIRHTIEIVADLMPQAAFTLPTEDEVELPSNGAMAIALTAVDPDYALAGVTLRAETSGGKLFDQPLLEKDHVGAFQGQHLFDASRFKLKVGDEVLYWAEAWDNKTPEPNRVVTARRKITIIDPLPEDERRDQHAQAEEDRDEQAKHNDRAGPPRPDQPDQDNTDQDESDQDEQPPEDQPKDEQEADPNQERKTKEQSKGNPSKSGQPKQDDQPDDKQNDEPKEDSAEEEGSQEGEPKQDGSKEDGSKEDGSKDEGASGGGKKKEDGSKKEGEGGKADQNKGEGEKEPSERVDPESNAGDAFDKITEHLDEKKREKQEQEQPAAGSEKKQDQGTQPDSKEPKDEQSSDEQKGPGEQPGGEADPSNPNEDKAPGEAAEQPAGKDGQGGEGGAGESETGEFETGEPDEKSQGGKKQKADAEKQPGEGGDPSEEKTDDPAGDNPADDKKPGQQSEGAEGATKPAVKPDKDPQPKAGDDASEETPGDPDKQKGDAGAGKAAGQKNDTGGAGEKNSKAKKKEKQPKPGESEKPQEGDDPKAPAYGEKESDSEGEEDGDRKGGGQTGSGQNAPQPGAGGAGSNTEAEDGASHGESAGSGNTSEKGGDKKPGGDTGDPNAKQQDGPGGKTKAGGDKQGTGDQAQDPKKEQNPTPDTKPGKKQEGAGPQSAGGAPGDSRPGEPTGDQHSGEGGGAPPRTLPPPKKNDEGEPGGSDPNLDYANQATDLALDHLKDELKKDEPDPELLDKLGWTREDMEEFVRRWEEMKRQAKAQGEQGEDAKQKLDEELKSLGLRPKGTSLSSDQIDKEVEHTRLRESRHSEPPPEYAEQYKAYTQGRAKGRKK